jgi:hypothetical protein
MAVAERERQHEADQHDQPDRSELEERPGAAGA